MRATVRMALLLLSVLAGRAASAPADLEAIRDYLDRGMLRTAKVRLAAYVGTSPDCPEGQALLAEARLVEGDWSGAEAAARRALELGEPLAREWMLWGRARMEQGRAGLRTGRPADAAKAWFRQAEHGFRQARAIEPEHPDALWRWGQAREWKGDGATAEQFYESQIREHPDHPGGYRRLGQLLDHRADRAVGDEAPSAVKLRTQALAVFEKGLSSAGDDAELHHLRAVVLEKQGERAAAVASPTRMTRPKEFSMPGIRGFTPPTSMRLYIGLRDFKS